MLLEVMEIAPVPCDICLVHGTPNALDGRSIKAGEGKESTGEEAESRW